MYLLRAISIHLFKGKSWRLKGKGKAGESEAETPRYYHDLIANACGLHGKSAQASKQISVFENFAGGSGFSFLACRSRLG
jgi:hypothetical protein